MKTIDINKTVYTLCKENDGLKQILFDIGFIDITKPLMLETAGRFVTLKKGMQMKKIDFNTLELKLKQNGYIILKGEDINE